MRKAWTKPAAIAAGTVLTLALLPGAAQAKPEPPERQRSFGVDAEAKKLDALYLPLNGVANALDAVGRSKSGSALYSTLYENGPAGIVDLWLTDTSPRQVGLYLAAARRLDPHAQWNRVRIHKGAYSRALRTTTAEALLRQSETHQLPYTITEIGNKPDGSGLTVNVSDVGAAHRYAARLAARLKASASQASASVNLTFQPSRPVRLTSSSYNKFDDSNNQIGGDQISSGTNGKFDACTAGFAADDAQGNQYLVTAGHCFYFGDIVKSGSGAYTVGTVVAGGPDRGGYNRRYDSELIQGNASGNYYNDEGEGSTPSNSWWAVLSGGHAYSLNGQPVCQNGMMTSYSQGRTPCNIVVTDQNHFLPMTDGLGDIQGVLGVTMDHSIGAMSGDSGGTVFTYNGGNRQLRGIEDAITYPALFHVNGWPDQWGSDTVFWVEATDILNTYHLTQDTKP